LGDGLDDGRDEGAGVEGLEVDAEKTAILGGNLEMLLP
jgi:hypothetical protein